MKRLGTSLLILISLIAVVLFLMTFQQHESSIHVHAHGVHHSHHHDHHEEEEEAHDHHHFQHHRQLSSIEATTVKSSSSDNKPLDHPSTISKTTTTVKGTDSSKRSTLSVWIYSLASSFGVSLLSLVGASLLFYGCSSSSRYSSSSSSATITTNGKSNHPTTENREQQQQQYGSPSTGNLQFILSCVAIGSLLGDVFLHLMPILYAATSHDEEDGHDHADGAAHQHIHGNNSSSFVILLAFLGCLLIEVYLRVKQQREERNAEVKHGATVDDDHHHHSTNNNGNRSKTMSHHHHHHHHIKAVGWLNLIGDAIHNFMDGAGIAGAFQISIPVGVANVLCICMHEIPQELSDYGILLSAGFSVKNALFFNFLSGVLSVVGCIFGLLLTSDHGFQMLFINKNHLIAMSAGSFLYIATSMIPIVLEELVQSDNDFRPSIVEGITNSDSVDSERKGKDYQQPQFARKFIYALSGVLAGFLIMHFIGSYEEHVTNLVSSMYRG
ncbi:hypothetical protein C9374_003592 [Naegleria lovaniensis]|uniref:Uncharacterized protein n=1 Tax=Naegleria lovaniensis TaxID=51637 RepID=A0AA88GZE0_NAELO|nr:uncharacterized protein C9374_003592 [Naegleria lovaniensis]KAG2393828.1 hypothetical protein C9374_003592 [Naegleria lovaniensis]